MYFYLVDNLGYLPTYIISSFKRARSFLNFLQKGPLYEKM